MMELRVVLLLAVCTWGVSGRVDHAELRGEHPQQEDIDNGECIPIPCVMGLPPKNCKSLCDSHGYETICQKPADFCLCRHMVHGAMKLVSPDEVDDQPPESSEEVDKPSEKSKVTLESHEPAKIIGQPPTGDNVKPEVVDQPQDQSESGGEEGEGIVSFQIFAVFLPIKQYLYDTMQGDEDPKPEPSADPLSFEYESVNVHEGRLFWDFRYILTGLLLLMIGLVVYELIMCSFQVYNSKRDISVRCEEPQVKVKPPFIGNEKILNV